MNISLSEILVILLVALLVIKPDQLPEVAAMVGRAARLVRGFMTKVRKEVDGFIEPLEKPNESNRERP